MNERNDRPAPLYGLVLMGGRSTRMGTDKSRLTYHGKPQREHLTDLLQPYCDAVFWSVNAQQEAQLPDADQLLIVDAFTLNGPLNGIASAFARHPSVAWLAVACDMPRLTNRTLDALVTNRNPAKPATAFWDSDGRFPEPLLAIWEPAVAPLIRQAVAEGNVSPRKLLMVNDTQLLTAPDAAELLNVNDGAAYDTFRRGNI